MTGRATLLFAALFASLTATASLAADPAAQAFVGDAARLNLFQIRSGELAKERAAGEATRAYAEEVVARHKETQDDLVAAAGKDVQAPAELDPEQKEKLSALEAAPKADFDAAFLSAQISTYAAAGRLYQSFIKEGPAGPVRAFAEQTYPELHMLEVRANALSSPAAVTEGNP
jgi:predicted outer membrane protein